MEAKNHVKHGVNLKSLISGGNFLKKVCLPLLAVSMLLCGCPKEDPREPRIMDDETFFKILRSYVDSCLVHHAPLYEMTGIDLATSDTINKINELGGGLPSHDALVRHFSNYFAHNESERVRSDVTGRHEECIYRGVNLCILNEVTKEDSKFNFPPEKAKTLRSDLLFSFENKERPNRVTHIRHKDDPDFEQEQ